jgi:Flp pilus assembly protein TadD
MPDPTDLYTRALLAAESWVDVAEGPDGPGPEPENAAALNALGYTLADQTERYEEAEALSRQAYILQPNEASIIDSMGWVAYKQGRYGEAEEFLRRAWTLDRNPEIAAHLGEVLWMSGRKEDAVKAWREAQEIDARNPVLMETLERLGVVSRADNYTGATGADAPAGCWPVRAPAGACPAVPPPTAKRMRALYEQREARLRRVDSWA